MIKCATSFYNARLYSFRLPDGNYIGFGGVTIRNGIYVVANSDWDEYDKTCILRYTNISGEIKRLDKKFIPYPGYITKEEGDGSYLRPRKSENIRPKDLVAFYDQYSTVVIPVSPTFVDYSTSQNLTESQKAQARNNIGITGTVEDTAIILKSTTSGSSKRFKITVDDTGTLSVKQL